MKLRIAVAGAGLIGIRHIEEIVASPNCALASLVDPGPKAPDIARQYGVTLFQSLSECFAKDRAGRRCAGHAEPPARRAGAGVH
jgi:predicted dehydrogenase